jgi:hypothetical protein
MSNNNKSAEHGAALTAVNNVTNGGVGDSGGRNYYKDIVPGYEYMQLMEHVLGHEGVVGHLKGQIFKYLSRMGKKDSGVMEATKVAWYSAYLRDYLRRHEIGATPYKPAPPEPQPYSPLIRHIIPTDGICTAQTGPSVMDFGSTKIRAADFIMTGTASANLGHIA